MWNGLLGDWSSHPSDSTPTPSKPGRHVNHNRKRPLIVRSLNYTAAVCEKPIHNMSAREKNEKGGGSPLPSCSSIVVREMQNPGGGNRGGGEIAEIAFSANGAHLLTGAKNFAVRVWNTRSGDVEMCAPPLVSKPSMIPLFQSHWIPRTEDVCQGNKSIIDTYMVCSLHDGVCATAILLRPACCVPSSC